MKTEILRLITENSPIKKEDLLVKVHAELFSFGIDYHVNPVSERKLRRLIEEMVYEGEKIGSSQRGYFITRCDQDVFDAIRPLKAKAAKEFKRADQIWKNYYGNKSAQLSIESFLNER